VLAEGWHMLDRVCTGAMAERLRDDPKYKHNVQRNLSNMIATSQAGVRHTAVSTARVNLRVKGQLLSCLADQAVLHVLINGKT
jgi:hypothetical protein